MVLLMLSIAPAPAQQRIETLENLLFSRFDPTSGKLLRIFNDHYSITDPDSISGYIHPLPGIGKLLETHNAHLLKGVVTLVKKGSGPILQLQEGKAVRIDRSLDHRFQEYAVEFVRNDTLFRHGGYGFWEARNHISYFSETTLEWEILRPIQGNNFPPGLFMHHYLLAENRLYLYGGFTINPWNRVEKEFNNEVWCFDFSSYRWSHLGTIDPLIRNLPWDPNRGIDPEESFKAYTGQNQFTLVNAAENRIDRYLIKPEFYILLTFQGPRPFRHNDHFHFYRPAQQDSVKSQTQQRIRLDYLRIDAGRIIDRPVERVPFYHSEFAWFSPWLITLPIAIALGWVALRRRKGTVKSAFPTATLSSDGLRFNGMDYKLEPVAVNVLRLLLSRGEDVPSTEITALVAKPNLDHTNRVRSKNLLLRGLNLELRSIFRIGEDIIVQTDSPADRRIKCYRINRSWFSNDATAES